MSATKESAGYLGSVADDPAAAVLTDWSDRVNCALKAVEYMPRTGADQLEGLIVVIPTDFTPSHRILHRPNVGFVLSAGGCTPPIDRYSSANVTEH